jgi:hypothetical protein
MKTKILTYYDIVHMTPIEFFLWKNRFFRLLGMNINSHYSIYDDVYNQQYVIMWDEND